MFARVSLYSLANFLFGLQSCNDIFRPKWTVLPRHPFDTPLRSSFPRYKFALAGRARVRGRVHF